MRGFFVFFVRNGSDRADALFDSFIKNSRLTWSLRVSLKMTLQRMVSGVTSVYWAPPFPLLCPLPFNKRSGERSKLSYRSGRSLIAECILVHFEVKQVRIYYGLGTGGRCCICARQTLCMHSPGGSTFLHEITPWPPSWKYDVVSEIRLSRSIRRTILPNFILIRFETTELWASFEECRPQQEEQQQEEQYEYIE